MKLLDILAELTAAELSPEQKRELFKQGSLLVPLPADPDRPETTSSQVINLPKMDQIKKDIIQNKREFDVYMFSSDPDIKNTAKEINKLGGDKLGGIWAILINSESNLSANL